MMTFDDTELLNMVAAEPPQTVGPALLSSGYCKQVQVTAMLKANY